MRHCFIKTHYIRSNWAKPNLFNPIFLQSDCINLWYFKLRVFNLINTIYIWNISVLQHWGSAFRKIVISLRCLVKLLIKVLCIYLNLSSSTHLIFPFSLCIHCKKITKVCVFYQMKIWKLNKNRILLRLIFEILIIHKPSVGSCDVPHKIWARSV